MLELICLILGLVLLIAGIAIPNIAALIVGVILLAIGGVWIFFIDTDGIDW